MSHETTRGTDGSRRFALVTGASSGIGRAIAVALGCAGFTVILTGRRRDALLETAGLIQPPEACIACIPCDLADSGSLATLVERVRGLTDDRLSLLVNCAGIFHHAAFGATDAAMLDALFTVNFRAPYLLTKDLLPALRTGPGTVVFINSTAALNAPANISAYSASKAALKAAADSLRREFADEDLRVLNVFSGRSDTPMAQQVFEAEGRAPHPELLVQPEDVATAVVMAATLPPRAQITNLHVTTGRRLADETPAPPATEHASSEGRPA